MQNITKYNKEIKQSQWDTPGITKPTVKLNNTNTKKKKETTSRFNIYLLRVIPCSSFERADRSHVHRYRHSVHVLSSPAWHQ